MKRLFALLMAACLLLCGCGTQEPDPTELPPPSTEDKPIVQVPTTKPTEPPTTAATDPTEPPETQPQGFPNPLTGVYGEEEVVNRPYAVVFNNSRLALPHWSVSQLDMLWELPHEDNITRMMGIFTDVSQLEKVGSLRSSRPYHISLAQSLDAIFVHAGGTTAAYSTLRSTKWNNLDGVMGKGAWKYYHRDQDRLNAGVALEHTMYITGKEILEYTKELGYTTTRGEVLDYGLQFATDGTPEGETAQNIRFSFRNGGKENKLYYNADAGKYTLEQFGITYVDGLTGNAVGCENVLILEAEVGRLDDEGHLTVDLVSSGDGYFACGGKLIPIRWNRGSTSSFFTFTLTDGTPLTMGTGNSYVAVVYENAPVIYS